MGTKVGCELAFRVKALDHDDLAIMEDPPSPRNPVNRLNETTLFKTYHVLSTLLHSVSMGGGGRTPTERGYQIEAARRFH